jgi:hypothetical protein
LSGDEFAKIPLPMLIAPTPIIVHIMFGSGNVCHVMTNNAVIGTKNQNTVVSPGLTPVFNKMVFRDVAVTNGITIMMKEA